MEQKIVITTNEIELGSQLLLKNGKKAIVEGYYSSMFPSINEIYLFVTDIGKILPKEVEKILDKSYRSKKK